MVVEVVVTGHVIHGPAHRINRMEISKAINRMANRKGNVQKAIRAHPIGRIGRPEECAYAIVMLCSPRASFINCATLAVDSGATQY